MILVTDMAVPIAGIRPDDASTAMRQGPPHDRQSVGGLANSPFACSLSVHSKPPLVVPAKAGTHLLFVATIANGFRLSPE